MASSRDPSAQLAERCISRLLGVHVEHWDVPPRQGAYDLRYERLGRSVAVEVKLLVDPDYQAARSEAAKTGYVRCRELAKTWIVDLEHTASWKEARRALPYVLMELEHLHWPGGGDFWRLRHMAPALRMQAAALGLESVWPVDPTEMHPPGFYLMPAGWGAGVPGVNALPDFCDGQLASGSMLKLRQQFADAGTDERHAFFVVGWEHMIISALTDASKQLPATAPRLVEGIDAVWVTPIITGSRVLAWFPGEGWRQAPAPPLDTLAIAVDD